MKDLHTQQHALLSSDQDVRITNLARFVYKHLPIRSGSLIDVGAGNGLLLKFFKQRGFTVEGIELEENQVHRMKNDPNLKGVKVSQGDITKLKGKSSYNVVVASDVIEHIEDDQLALKRLFELVAPGGYLIITVPAHQHLFGIRDRKWGHYRRYDKRDLAQKLGALGGETVSCRFWNFMGYFAYFYYERIKKQPIREGFRYSTSLPSKIIRTLIGFELAIEEKIGTPIGLTLVGIVRKKG